MEDVRNEYKFLPGHEGKQHFERSLLNGKIILTLQFTKVECEAGG